MRGGRGAGARSRGAARAASATRESATAGFRCSRSARWNGAARRRRPATEDAKSAGRNSDPRPPPPDLLRADHPPHPIATTAGTQATAKRTGTAAASDNPFEAIPGPKAAASWSNRRDRGSERKRPNVVAGNRTACRKNSSRVPCAASVAASMAGPAPSPRAKGIRASRKRAFVPSPGPSLRAVRGPDAAPSATATAPPAAAARTKSCLNHTVQPARSPARRARRRGRTDGDAAATSVARTRTRPVSRDLRDSVCVGRTTKRRAAAAAASGRAAQRARRNTRTAASATTPTFTARSTSSVAPKTRNAPARSRVVPGGCRVQKSRYGISPARTRVAAQRVLPSS